MFGFTSVSYYSYILREKEWNSGEVVSAFTMVRDI